MISAQSAGMGWQPIETAPRDGTEIIGLFSRRYDENDPPTIYGPWTVAFDGKKWRSSWDGQEVVEYMDDFGTQYKGPDIDPTHWQPMPDALPISQDAPHQRPSVELKEIDKQLLLAALIRDMAVQSDIADRIARAALSTTDEVTRRDLREILSIARENEAPLGSSMILTPEAFEKLMDVINNPKPPTQALIDLMKSTPPWDETDQTISTGR